MEAFAATLKRCARRRTAIFRPEPRCGKLPPQPSRNAPLLRSRRAAAMAGSTGRAKRATSHLLSMQSSNLDGVLLIDKASGMTSHDVVAIVRRRLNIKKVGHCGTLDPLATGLLIIVIGRGTKIQDLLMAEDKEYAGAMLLGVTTDSQDADGEVQAVNLVPPFTRGRDRGIVRQISRRFLPDAADGFRDQEGWRAALQAGAARQSGGARAALRACLRARDPGDRAAGDPIFASSARRASTCALMPSTSAKTSAAARICKELRRTKSGRFSVGAGADGRAIADSSRWRDHPADARSANSLADAWRLRRSGAPAVLT